MPESEQEERLIKFWKELIESQEVLPPEFLKALNENRWELYE